MKTPYAFEHHIFNPQVVPCHLRLFAISSRDLNKLRGKERGLTFINHLCLPSTMLSALHTLSHWILLQSCEPCITPPIYRWWNWGRERLNHLPRSHGYEVTALCIIYTQLETYVIFKVVKRVGKFSISAVSKKIFEMLLLDEYIVSNYKNGLKWKEKKRLPWWCSG